jgi:large conductance mechanosensitive channel
MSEKQSRLAEFKDFVLKGNVVDLAVAVIIATFFGVIIKDLVNLILSIFAIPGRSFRPFAGLQFTIGHGVFQYGILLTDIITFVIVAAVVFFLVVHPVRVLMDRRRSGVDPESEDRACPECLSDIPKAAIRCRFCTAPVEPVPESPSA